MHSDHDQHNKSRSNREREGIPAVLIVSALVFIVLLLIGIGASYVLLSDPTQDKTIQESYKSLAKKRVSESPFPAELTASFARKTDRWAANGPVTNEDLSQLSRTKRIDALELNYSDVTAEGFKSLKTQPVSLLLLTSSTVTAAEMDVFSQLPALRKLNIYDSTSRLTDETVEHLTAPKELIEITLRGSNVTEKGIKTLSERFPHINNIDLMYSKTVDDKCIQFLSKFPEINSINVGFTGITADGAAKLSKIKDIHCLYVAGVGITDSAVREIAKCKTITRLDISNSKITDESLRELIKMPALAILQVSNCKQLSDMALNEFRKARPSCEVQTFVRMKAKDMD